MTRNFLRGGTATWVSPTRVGQEQNREAAILRQTQINQSSIGVSPTELLETAAQKSGRSTNLDGSDGADDDTYEPASELITSFV